MFTDSSIDPIIVSRNAFPSAPIARVLTTDDIPQLLDLEAEKWDDIQAASAGDMAGRIAAYPELAIGAFDPRCGRALASLFLKPIAANFWQHAKNWSDCVECVAPRDTRCLFGISLSGRDDGGVDAVEEFLWPHLARLGWNEVFLGSPIPGWARWHEQNPSASVEDYVARRRSDGLPCDPQLHYYHRRGFREVLCVKPGYFPHERSLDHGVIIRRNVVQVTAPWRGHTGEHAAAEGAAVVA